MLARDGKISLQKLYAESGTGRDVFYRNFSGKEALLAALAGDDVKALNDMTAAMAPSLAAQVSSAQPERRLAQSGGVRMIAPLIVPATAPAEPRVVPADNPPASVDAWLERRLRVFERALASLESRQEKAERELARSLAVLEQKLVTPLAVAALKVTWPEETAPQQVVLPEAPAPRQVKSVHAPTAEETKPEPVAATVAAMDEQPQERAAVAPMLENATPEEPISEREVNDFLAHARAAAQRASIPEPRPAKSVKLPRWIAWMGVAAVTLLLCAGVELSNVARATQIPAGAIAHRAVPQNGAARLMALADSGDARAQTVLALNYLHSNPGDNQAALRWSQAAAQQGEPVAEYVLGALVSKQDAPRAFAMFQDAALHGNLKAMHNLAIAYAQGQGTAEDDKRAAAWFGRAAAQGYVDSQFDLAVLFERGQGVKQNRIAALKWYLIAASHGDAPSQRRAAQLRTQMTDAEASIATAQAGLCAAAA